MKIINILKGKINKTELLKKYSLERPLIKDEDWNLIAGEACRVLEFEPMAAVENGEVHDIGLFLPYAAVILEFKGMPHPVRGCISHKIDFKNLWAAFKERPLGENEEVIIFWIKHRLKGIAKMTSRALPGLSVMVFKKEAFELITDETYRPELKDEARWEAERMIAEWTPEIYQHF